MTPHILIRSLDRGATAFLIAIAAIAILLFIILFIQKRPRGMFALKGRAVEA